MRTLRRIYHWMIGTPPKVDSTWTEPYNASNPFIKPAIVVREVREGWVLYDSRWNRDCHNTIRGFRSLYREKKNDQG